MPDAPKDNKGDHPTAPETSTSSSASFPSFNRLPPELSTRIITLACRSPELTSKDEAVKKRSRLALDVQTTLSLTLVSKSVAKVANATLYETIRITKPSALLELHATLDARPDLANLIRNLHVGSEGTLPTSEWPLVFDFPRGNERMTKLLLQSTVFLTSYGAAGEVPSWLKHAHRWPVEIREVGEDTPDKDGQWAAIARAVRAAVDYVDLNLYKREYSKSGKKIGLELWATRTFELQGCLDLYIKEALRLEKAVRANTPAENKGSTVSTAANVQYPELAVTGFSSDASRAAAQLQSSPQVFVISRAQLWQHLIRRGAALDQFDHPILFARTGFCSLPLSEYGRSLVGYYLKGPYRGWFNAEDAGEEQQEDPAEHEERTIDSLGLAPHHTIGGLAGVTSNIIALCPNLVNLSLLGTLQLCLSVPLPTYETLRSFSLGPLLPFWDETGCLHGCASRLKELENLRVCGAFIDAEEADQIAGKDGCFPKLKRAQWELVESYKPYDKPGVDPTHLIKQLERLQGDPIPLDSPQPPSRLIEVRLHPETCKSIFELLPKPTRKAWKANKRLDVDGKGTLFAPHRIRITESDAAKCGPDHAEIGVRRLHQGARKWFEECAALAKKGDDKGEEWMPSAGGGYSLAPRRRVKFKYDLGEMERSRQMDPDGLSGFACMNVEVSGEQTESEGEQERFRDWARICGEREN